MDKVEHHVKIKIALLNYVNKLPVSINYPPLKILIFAILKIKLKIFQRKKCSVQIHMD
jgi:hypothetical protein